MLFAPKIKHCLKMPLKEQNFHSSQFFSLGYMGNIPLSSFRKCANLALGTILIFWNGWTRASFLTFLTIGCMWLDVRLRVIYSNCLSSVYAMLTCIIHQLSHKCPELITYLRLFGSFMKKHTQNANVPKWSTGSQLLLLQLS